MSHNKGNMESIWKCFSFNFFCQLFFTVRAGGWFSFILASTLHSKCGMSVINVTRFSQIHNLKGQEITQLNGFYLNFCLHLEQANGFHLYSCKLTTFCMQDVCYQFDKVCPSTQPEWMANNSDGQLLLGRLFTLVAGECFSFILL